MALEAGNPEVNRIHLRRQMLPFLKGRSIGEIAREDVQARFRSFHATPAAANRSVPIPSVVTEQAAIGDVRLRDRRHSLASRSRLAKDCR